MGQSSSSKELFSGTTVNFSLGRVIGRGSFGKVYAVTNRDTNTLFALKLLNKRELINKKMVRRTLEERDILVSLSGTFIVNLQYAFQTPKDLCVVLDLMAGGSISFHLKKERHFPWNRVLFYSRQILLALEFLHEHRILHRDIKPDNLLLDGNGNCHVTDFNVSVRLVDSDSVKGVSGSLSYMAPEVFDREYYSYGVDVWSFGVVMFEMGIGKVPFCNGVTQEERKECIRAMMLDYPSEMSEELKDLLRKIFVKQDARIRLRDMKVHPYFQTTNWDDVQAKSVEPPFIPEKNRAYVDGRYDLEEQFQRKQKLKPLSSQEQQFFAGWDYNKADGIGTTDPASKAYDIEFSSTNGSTN